MPDASARQDVFRGMMMSLSYPGRLIKLPSACSGDGLGWAAESLLDLECSYCVAGVDTEGRWARTGAYCAPSDVADYVIVPAWGRSAREQLGELRQGTFANPDRSATVLARACFNTGDNVSLEGPGIQDVLNVQLAGIPWDFWAFCCSTSGT
jgi:phosphonate C-P lyase system protein PhnH